MNIIVLDGHTANPGDLSWQPLKSLGRCTIYDRTGPKKTVARAIDADIIITNKVILSRSHLKQLPNLKYIGVIATGYNVVDLNAAAERLGETGQGCCVGWRGFRRRHGPCQ